MVLWGPRSHIFWNPFQFLIVTGYFSWILINKHKTTINSRLVKDSEPNERTLRTLVQLALYVTYFGLSFPSLAEQPKALKVPGRALLNELPLKIKRSPDGPKQRFVNYGFKPFFSFPCLCVVSTNLMKRWWITAYISILLINEDLSQSSLEISWEK